MLTLDAATQLGYTIEVDPNEADLCSVVRDGETVGVVRSSCPHFFALRFIAEIEGDELATVDVTPELVSQVSGESLVDDPVTPEAAPATAADLILGAIGKLDPATASAGDVISAIKSALDASGATATDPAVQTAAGPSGASANL